MNYATRVVVSNSNIYDGVEEYVWVRETSWIRCNLYLITGLVEVESSW